MRIAYNGVYLSRPYTGIGCYLRGLLPALAAELPKHEHVVIVPESLEVELPAGWQSVVAPPQRRWLGQGIALDHWEAHVFAAAAREAQANVCFIPYPTPPVSGLPIVMTVHDTIPWDDARYRRGWRKQLKSRRQLTGIRAANHLVTVSQTSAAAIQRYGIAPDRITVGYESIDQLLSKPATQEAVEAAQRKYGLDRPYLLYIGGFDPRKRVAMLVEAFLNSDLPTDFDLVIAGQAADQPLYADYQAVRRRASGQSRIILPGFVSEAEKSALLTGASRFIYPSEAEGFGLPPLEALAAGTPAVVADRPYARELFAGAVTWLPEAPTEWATTIAGALPAKAKAQAVLEKYTWPATAQIVATALTKTSELRA